MEPKLSWKSDWGIARIVKYQKHARKDKTEQRERIRDSSVKECEPQTPKHSQYPRGSLVSSVFTFSSWIQAGIGVQCVPHFLFYFLFEKDGWLVPTNDVISNQWLRGGLFNELNGEPSGGRMGIELHVPHVIPQNNFKKN